jgi:hypothetical protein
VGPGRGAGSASGTDGGARARTHGGRGGGELLYLLYLQSRLAFRVAVINAIYENNSDDCLARDKYLLPWIYVDRLATNTRWRGRGRARWGEENGSQLLDVIISARIHYNVQNTCCIEKLLRLHYKGLGDIFFYSNCTIERES